MPSSCHDDLEIIRYSSDRKEEWDQFVNSANNGHFFFLRDYMEYHSERFEDFSFLVYCRSRLIAVLPANRKDGTVYSHQGLTYGGFITGDRVTGGGMLDMFSRFIRLLGQKGISEFVYKAMPYIYYLKPAQEDRYALFVNGGELFRCELSSVVSPLRPIRYSKGKKWNINKGRKQAFEIRRTDDFGSFMDLLSEILQKRHGARPVHTETELTSLASRFPEKIQLFAIYSADKQMIAGALLFINETVVHTQYLANSAAGLKTGALDFLLDYLIRKAHEAKKYFSFGISTENGGAKLNRGLLQSKEDFGAKAVIHETYRIEISKEPANDSGL